jgi:1-acyl-sn-glycerol-3-phosphate acyltransferase
VQQSLFKNIIHPFFRIWIKCTSYFFFEKVIVTGKDNIPSSGPVILACNHPDSFLDALLITAYYKRPIYYLARGDVFSSKFISSILHFLNIIPIYRKEEGVIHFPKNESTFTFCIEAFKENGTVLIFSEGGSENKWELRQLRKGTARLAYDAWHNIEIGTKLEILPVAIVYSAWMQLNTVANLTFIETITAKDIPDNIEHGLFLRKFNESLKNSLSQKCLIISRETHEELQKILTSFLIKNKRNGRILAAKAVENISNGSETIKEKTTLFANYLKTHNLQFYSPQPSLISFIIGVLIIPIVYILNFLPYYLCKYLTKQLTHLNEFYDSVLFCLLLFFYPIYLIGLFFIGLWLSHSLLFSVNLIILTLLTAKLNEWAKRNINCFINKEKMAIISVMLHEIFEKDSD